MCFRVMVLATGPECLSSHPSAHTRGTTITNSIPSNPMPSSGLSGNQTQVAYAYRDTMNKINKFKINIDIS